MKHTLEEITKLEKILNEYKEIDQRAIYNINHATNRVNRAFYIESGKLALQPIEVEETHEVVENDGKSYLLGEPEIYEPYTQDISELYHSFADEHGLCQGIVNRDLPNGEVVPVGYIFWRKRHPTSLDDTYDHYVWISFIKRYNGYRYYINIENNQPIMFHR